MGRTYFDHLGGARVIMCVECGTPLTNKDNLESGEYRGSSGKAYLFTRAVNLSYSQVVERIMLTGKHFVRDVFCKKCNKQLGWMYEFAVEKTQRHKEGKFILEKAYIKECR